MIKGSCLCGAVRYEHPGPVQILNYCHCSRCRKSSGAAFGSFLHAKAEGFRWVSGADRVRTWVPAEGATLRAFCPACGSKVPVLEDDDVIFPAGSLDTDPGVKGCVHILTGSKAPWFEITDELKQFEEFPSDEWIEDALEQARRREE